MAEDPIRYFTFEEANATLPYVRGIVGDIVKTYGRWRDGVHRYELVAADSRSEVGETDEQAALRDEVDAIARQISAYIEELAAVGCILKGFDDGLIDFRSRLDGRDILLCWKLGEPEIMHWHETDAGFAGRQKIAPALVQDASN